MDAPYRENYSMAPVLIPEDAQGHPRKRVKVHDRDVTQGHLFARWCFVIAWHFVMANFPAYSLAPRALSLQTIHL